MQRTQRLRWTNQATAIGTNSWNTVMRWQSGHRLLSNWVACCIGLIWEKWELLWWTFKCHFGPTSWIVACPLQLQLQLTKLLICSCVWRGQATFLECFLVFDFVEWAALKLVLLNCLPVHALVEVTFVNVSVRCSLGTISLRLLPLTLNCVVTRSSAREFHLFCFAKK